jgi:uncharacterized DUF497 family protein
MYIKQLIWDSWNIPHIARHKVIPKEVEQVCHGSYITVSTHDGRVLAIGPTNKKRMLAIVLAPKSKGLYYPVTARDADKKERQKYQQLKLKGGVII